MKTALLLWAVLATGNLISSAKADNVQPYGQVVTGYKLAWADEFNEPALDTAVWDYRRDSKMWSTQLPGNVRLAGGKLVIDLKKEAANGKAYTGGGIISKQNFGYGYYEASFKVPPGSGWHTSFWAMAYDGKGTKPVGTQEIDFCEQDSVKTTCYSAGILAWGNGGHGIGRKYVSTPDLAQGFHVWGCDYSPKEVKFYFDGKLTHQADVSKIKQGPQKIWLTCIASTLGKTSWVSNKTLPATAEFDYVRFFEKETK